jgi:penicillin-binding protein 1A
LYVLGTLLGFIAVGAAVLAIAIAIAYPSLPSLEALTDYRPKVPLRIFTSDGQMIGEFGEERRAVVQIGEVPDTMKHAILAAEDERFYQHGGVDTLGILRAAYANLIGGGRRQGASTITMQVARNFFLSSEKTLTRKFYEALLSFKIEHNLSKDQILELYINQIYLGQRAYGFASAAQIYYGKPLKNISIAEAAMLAGLPKAPSSYNPVVNPKRARLRQQYVLRRMRELSFISEDDYKKALDEALVIKRDASEFGVHADYVAEMARQIAAERFPDEVYTRGLRVYTTLVSNEQEAAYRSLRNSLFDYDHRHGYRGAESYVDLSGVTSESDEKLDDLLQEIPATNGLPAAIVLAADSKHVRVYRGGDAIDLNGDAIKFAAHMLDDKAPPNKRIVRGAVVRLMKSDKGEWQISQLPDVEGAFVSNAPSDGAIHALVGGFDFNRNKFNHVTQAWRQPGSSFKPFIYSAALEKGFSPSSVVADEPIVISASETGSQDWQPHNYDNKYEGPMKLRTALAKSKNMVSIRILQAIGTSYAQDYSTRFGFDADKQPPYLTMALGAGQVTPWQMIRAYSVFANGGYKIQPYVVKEIRDEHGNLLASFAPQQAGDENLRAIDARNAYLMSTMLRDVATYGTAARASVLLKRHDLAGKTGTTNEYVDAWFCGFQKTLVGCAWVGFDQPRKLGSGETGGQAALPIWINYMREALKNVPEEFIPQPEGLSAVGEGKSRDLYYSENAPAEPPENEPPPPEPPSLKAPPTD